MSRYVGPGEIRPNGQTANYRVTDHSGEILRMRVEALTLFLKDENPTRRLTLAAAADLLEAHDDTGIVLDNWTAVRVFVEHVLGEPILFSEH